MELPGELALGGSWFQQDGPLGEGDAARTALARIDFQLGTNGGEDTGFRSRWQAFSAFIRRADHYVYFVRLWEAPLPAAKGRDGAQDRLALGRLCTPGANGVTTL